MKLNVYSYQFPFANPFITAKRSFDTRKGLLFQLKKDGLTALGEAAPLPGFSVESFPDMLHQLRQLQNHIASLLMDQFTLADLNHFFDEYQPCPSLQFALYTLCSSYLAQQHKASLHAYLFNSEIEKVPVNGVIDLKSRTPVRTVTEMKNDGFKTIKIKAGKDMGGVISRLNAIRQQHPDINIRVDANQSWSSRNARTVLKTLGSLDIEYCEEPLAAPEKQSLKSLKKYSSLPIALDESLTQAFTLQEAADIADILIVKPMVLGVGSTLDEIRNIRKANTAEIVFTTSLESAVGRLMTATLAAGLGSQNHAHGLSTGTLLTKDFWGGHPFVNNGDFNLADAKTLPKLMNSDFSGLPLKKIEL